MVDPDFTAPDVVGVVEGFRGWNVNLDYDPDEGPRLWSLGGHYLWKPREVNVAECPACSVSTQGIPGEKCSCVPLDTEILTQRGWLKHNEVQVGDRTLGINPATRHTEWTPVLRVIHNEAEPIYRVGSDYWSARATGDHGWPVWLGDGQGRLTTVELLGEKGSRRMTQGAVDTMEVVTRVPYIGGSGSLSPTEAAIIAWLHTDGTLSTQRIIQSKPVGVKALCTLLRDVPHTQTNCEATPIPGFNDWWDIPGADTQMFRLRSPYFRKLWQKAGFHNGSTLTDVVLSLDRPALEAFMEAALLAEGGWNGSARNLTQNVGATFDALNLGCYLLGYRPRVRVHDSLSSLSRQRGVCRRITLAHSPIRRPSLRAERLGVEPTWCVTTGLGTWTMRQDGQIMPTSNCGFYSAKTLEHFMSMHYYRYALDEEEPEYSTLVVIGKVANWGKVIEGTQGWRAQYAYPQALYVPYEAARIAVPLRKVYGASVRLANWLKPDAGLHL